jgi:transcriptional regulator with XRE-family HTH domain
MKFKDWLALECMSDAEFARKSGIRQRALVHKYRHGRQFPSPANLRRIREATNGQVTADDFVDEQTALPATSSPRAPVHEFLAR